jgi:hypothetical protein
MSDDNHESVTAGRSMEFIGRIVRLQVQVASLKVGEPVRYDPAPIRLVSRFALSDDGVAGCDERGALVLDVHNRAHAGSKNIRGVNGVSVGFSAHYDAMRERFGPHLSDGIAGENILVACDSVISLESLEHGLLIRGDDGRAVRLHRLRVAEPCLEFSRYAERLPVDAPPDGAVRHALQFLRQGMRGFYASLDGEPGALHLGDSVFRDP